MLDLRYFQLERVKAANDAERREIARARAALRARGGDVTVEEARLDARAVTLNAHVTDWRARAAHFKDDRAAFNADVDCSNARH